MDLYDRKFVLILSFLHNLYNVYIITARFQVQYFCHQQGSIKVTSHPKLCLLPILLTGFHFERHPLTIIEVLSRLNFLTVFESVWPMFPLAWISPYPCSDHILCKLWRAYMWCRFKPHVRLVFLFLMSFGARTGIKWRNRLKMTKKAEVTIPLVISNFTIRLEAWEYCVKYTRT